MWKLIARRLLLLPVVLLAIYSLTLALAWAVPGNPLERPEGRRPPPEVAQALKSQYKLDSFWGFYSSYLARVSGLNYLDTQFGLSASGKAQRNAFELQDQLTIAAGLKPQARPIFDFGPSLQYRDRKVNEIIAGSLPVSITVGTAAILLATILGVGTGLLGASKPGSLRDGLSFSVALIGVSLPSFVIGTILLLSFSVALPIFPVGHWGRLEDLVLPALTLSLPFAAYIARLTRMGLLEQLASDYVRTARAKGVPESVILYKHALKNAFLPVLSYLGPATALAMTGSFVVERVFRVPGMGQFFVTAVQNKDLFLIIGIVLVFSTMLILINLVVDCLYRWVDPRIASGS